MLGIDLAVFIIVAASSAQVLSRVSGVTIDYCGAVIEPCTRVLSLEARPAYAKLERRCPILDLTEE
jgi:hypothetical protein